MWSLELSSGTVGVNWCSQPKAMKRKPMKYFSIVIRDVTEGGDSIREHQSSPLQAPEFALELSGAS